MEGIEKVILNRLTNDTEYMRRVLPYLEESLFSTDTYKITYRAIKKFIDTYNEPPSTAALLIDLERDTTLQAKQAEEVEIFIKELKDPILVSSDWLLENTEKFVQNRSLYNAIMKSIQIYSGNDKKHNAASIPEFLTKALSVSFNPNIGHDFFENAKDRYEYYHKEESKISFDIDLLNLITKGGIIRKTLNVLMGSTGGGKSLTLCHFAANNYISGLNVLYITLEMSEEEILKRIDANLLNVTTDELMLMTREEYVSRINRIKNRTNGRLIVKEYPTSAANVNHFRSLLNELKLKKNFVPDVIYVDYINICSSARISLSAGSYGYVKSIAEELRGLAVETNTALWTATQTNRDGLDNSDPTMGNTSESIGLPFTTDLFLVLVATEELRKLNQMLVIQLKNRYNPIDFYRKFVVGCDRPKMKLYNVEQNAQDDIISDEDIPIMDMGEFGEIPEEKTKRKIARKNKLSMKGFG